MSHGIIRCSECDKIIAQCRCMESYRKITYQICDDCKTKIEEISEKEKKMPTVQIPKKLNRNAHCHCGSGKKYKKCCEKKEKIKMDEQTNIVTPQSLKNEYLNRIARILHSKTITRAEGEAICREVNQHVDEKVIDPYASIPEDELVTRDQAVLLKEIRLRKFVRELNITSLLEVIKGAQDLAMELLAMPMSPYRELCIANTNKMIENNQDVLKANKWPIMSEITLLALEELFEKPETEFGSDAEEIVKKAIAALPEDAEAEDELTIPEESAGDGVDGEDNPREAV